MYNLARTAGDVDPLFSEFPEDFGWVQDSMGVWRPSIPTDDLIEDAEGIPGKASTQVAVLLCLD